MPTLDFKNFASGAIFSFHWFLIGYIVALSDLNGIDVFVATVQAGNFAQAAETLQVTRSAVAKSIARLEARLGTPLFLRTTRSQQLTEAGALYYQHCLRALEEIRAGEAALESGRTQVAGRLRVSLPVLFGHLCIAPILLELARQHPALALDLQFNDRTVDLREEGIDLAIRIGALPDSSDLVARPLGEHRMAICASPAFMAGRELPHTVDALRGLEAVAYSRRGQVMEWKMQVDGEPQVLKPDARVQMDDLQGVADAAVAGLGVAWLPYWLVRDALQQGRLLEVLPAASSAIYPIHAVWPWVPHLPLKTRVAVDALLQQLPARLLEVEAGRTGER